MPSGCHCEAPAGPWQSREGSCVSPGVPCDQPGSAEFPRRFAPQMTRQGGPAVGAMHCIRFADAFAASRTGHAAPTMARVRSAILPGNLQLPMALTTRKGHAASVGGKAANGCAVVATVPIGACADGPADRYCAAGRGMPPQRCIPFYRQPAVVDSNAPGCPPPLPRANALKITASVSSVVIPAALPQRAQSVSVSVRPPYSRPSCGSGACVPGQAHGIPGRAWTGQIPPRRASPMRCASAFRDPPDFMERSAAWSTPMPASAARALPTPCALQRRAAAFARRRQAHRPSASMRGGRGPANSGHDRAARAARAILRCPWPTHRSRQKTPAGWSTRVASAAGVISFPSAVELAVLEQGVHPAPAQRGRPCAAPRPQGP